MLHVVYNFVYNAREENCDIRVGVFVKVDRAK
jgi:hypothetical protein